MIELDDYAHFTWTWGQEFFLEVTGKGNFVWSDPTYGGNGTIERYDGSYTDFLRKSEISFGRDKGQHRIRDYCGKNVIIVS